MGGCPTWNLSAQQLYINTRYPKRKFRRDARRISIGGAAFGNVVAMKENPTETMIRRLSQMSKCYEYA